MSWIQSEPQRHGTPLTLGDGSDPVGVLLPRPEAHHPAALRTHLRLEKTGKHREDATFNSREELYKECVKEKGLWKDKLSIYRDCFRIQLGENEISSLKVAV